MVPYENGMEICTIGADFRRNEEMVGAITRGGGGGGKMSLHKATERKKHFYLKRTAATAVTAASALRELASARRQDGCRFAFSSCHLCVVAGVLRLDVRHDSLHAHVLVQLSLGDLAEAKIRGRKAEKKRMNTPKRGPQPESETGKIPSGLHAEKQATRRTIRSEQHAIGNLLLLCFFGLL